MLRYGNRLLITHRFIRQIKSLQKIWVQERTSNHQFLRIKGGKIEDLTHMPLELTSKNVRRKQAEASETRKFAPVTIPVTKNQFRLRPVKDGFGTASFDGSNTASEVNLKFLFVPNWLRLEPLDKISIKATFLHV